MSDYTRHRELCEAGVRMLRRGGTTAKHNGTSITPPSGCMVAGAELRSGWQEPDAFGWGWHGTHLVECKTSRRDFLKEKQKWHRQEYHADYAIGRYRWYLTPPGIITSADDLRGWGLVEFDGRRFHLIRPSQTFEVRERGVRGEHVLLLTLCRMYCAEADVGPGVHAIGKYRVSTEPWRGPRMRTRLSKDKTTTPVTGGPS
jgi:hypothetical protein